MGMVVEKPHVRPDAHYPVREAARILGYRPNYMYAKIQSGYFKRNVDWGENEYNGRKWVSGDMIEKLWIGKGKWE